MRKIKIYFAAAITAALLLTGCDNSSKKIEMNQPFFQVDSITLSIPEASMFFYALGKSEEKENSKIADILWNAYVSPKDKTNYAAYMKQVVFYEELVNMCSLASLYEKEYSLSEQENLSISDNAKAYFGILDEQDIENLDISVENIENLFRIYTEALNMEKLFLRDWKGTVSEEEYRVCLVRRLVFPNYNSSTRFYEQYTSTDGEEYDSTLYKDEKILYVDKTSELQSNILDEIFELKNKQLSTVLSEDGEIVIYEMQNVFDVDLSEQRKNSIIDSMKKESWNKACSKYFENAQKFYNHDAWDELEFSNNDMYSDKLLRLFDFI